MAKAELTLPALPARFPIGGSLRGGFFLAQGALPNGADAVAIQQRVLLM
jgi:hypothetical protein